MYRKDAKWKKPVTIIAVAFIAGFLLGALFHQFLTRGEMRDLHDQLLNLEKAIPQENMDTQTLEALRSDFLRTANQVAPEAPESLNEFLHKEYTVCQQDLLASKVDVRVLQDREKGYLKDLSSLNTSCDRTSKDASVLSGQLEDCLDSLKGKNDAIESNNEEVDLYKDQVVDLQGQLSACKEEAQENSQLIGNSVRSFCCSFNDVSSGAIQSWSISGSNIVCSGEFTVDCATGETTIP